MIQGDSYASIPRSSISFQAKKRNSFRYSVRILLSCSILQMYKLVASALEIVYFLIADCIASTHYIKLFSIRIKHTEFCCILRAFQPFLGYNKAMGLIPSFQCQGRASTKIPLCKSGSESRIRLLWSNNQPTCFGYKIITIRLNGNKINFAQALVAVQTGSHSKKEYLLSIAGCS